MFFLLSGMLSAASFSISAVIHLCVPTSFTQLLVLTLAQPELNGQGERSELGFLPCREHQAAPKEAGSLCLCARTCERDTRGVFSPLTALNSCNIRNDTNLCSKLFVTDGYLTVLLQAR